MSAESWDDTARVSSAHLMANIIRAVGATEVLDSDQCEVRRLTTN